MTIGIHYPNRDTENDRCVTALESSCLRPIISPFRSGGYKMEPHDHKSPQAVIEALCAKGCRQVWREIKALEDGNPPREARGLTGPELDQVLTELKAIMAVYDSCSPDPDPSVRH